MRIKSSQSGAINALLIPLILCLLLLFGTIGFAVWAYAERTDYKNNSDQKAAVAAQVAVEKAKTEKENEFIEREKEPLKTYTSPSQFGSFSLRYPKTWSTYVETQNGSLVVTMHPDAVPQDPSTAYALRIEVVSSEYSQEVRQYESRIEQGDIRASAFSLLKVPAVIGLRLDGAIETEKNGSAVFLPLRDRTIKISTETQERIADFDNIILPNFEFRP